MCETVRSCFIWDTPSAWRLYRLLGPLRKGVLLITNTRHYRRPISGVRDGVHECARARGVRVCACVCVGCAVCDKRWVWGLPAPPPSLPRQGEAGGAHKGAGASMAVSRRGSYHNGGGRRSRLWRDGLPPRSKDARCVPSRAASKACQPWRRVFWQAHLFL